MFSLAASVKCLHDIQPTDKKVLYAGKMMCAWFELIDAVVKDDSVCVYELDYMLRLILPVVTYELQFMIDEEQTQTPFAVEAKKFVAKNLHRHASVVKYCVNYMRKIYVCLCDVCDMKLTESLFLIDYTKPIFTND